MRKSSASFNKLSISVLAAGMAPTSGGTSSFAFLLLAGKGSVALAGEDA